MSRICVVVDKDYYDSPEPTRALGPRGLPLLSGPLEGSIARDTVM
jgi:hypothetical protein